MKAHPAVGQSKAGMYLNPNAVRFAAYGTEIINAPSADQVFGNAAPVVPFGGSSSPIAPAGFIVPPQGSAQVPAAPHFDVVPPALQPQQPAPQVAAMPQWGAPAQQAPTQPQWQAPQGQAPMPGPAMPTGMPPFPGQR